MFSTHLANGFSAEISLYVLEAFLLGWSLFFVRHVPPRLLFCIAGGFVALVFLRPFSHVVLTLCIVPAAVVCLAGFAMGRMVASDAAYLRAYSFALLFSALFSTLACGFQWLGLDIYLPRFFFPSVEGPGGRTIGILGQSNHVGFLIVTSIFVLAAIWTQKTITWQSVSSLRRHVAHATWFALYVVLIFGAASTRSRTALACAVIGAGFWIWTWRARPVWMTTVLAAFPVLLLSAEWSMRWIWTVTQFSDLNLHTPGTSNAAQGLKLLSTEHPRLGLWSHALAIVAERPWFGWGWKQTRLGLLESSPDIPHFELFDNSHNLFLELAIYFGIPVSALVFVLICGLILKFRPWKETRFDRVTAWLILGCMLAYSQVEFPLWYLHFISLAAMAAGYLWFNPNSKDASTDLSPSLGLRATVATTIILASAGAFIDYQWAARAYGRSLLWPPKIPGQVTPHEMLASQSTILFGPYTSFAISLQPAGLQLSDEQLVYYAEYALPTAPEPALLFKLIGAHQRLGHKERVSHLTERAMRQFPASFRVASGSPIKITPVSQSSHVSTAR